MLALAACGRVLEFSKVSPPADAGICFSDTFDGTTIGSNWSLFATPGTNVVISQQDALTFHFIDGAKASSYNSLTSVDAHDFGEGAIVAELVQGPSLHRETGLRLVRSQTEYYGLDVRWAAATDPAPTLSGKKNDSTLVFSRLYDPTIDRWFRIAIEGAQVRFATSPDGVSWEVHSSQVTFATEVLSVEFHGYVPSAAVATDPADDVVWDNFTASAIGCP